MSSLQDLLPGVESVKRIQLRPGDAIVVECERELSTVERDNLKGLVESIWPGHRVSVWPPSLRMKVVSPIAGAHVVEDGAGVHLAQD